MGRKGVSAALALGLAFCGAAHAQEGPSFPGALDRQTLMTWLSRETDIAPDRVVAVTPQALTSVVSTFPAGAGMGPRVVIRAEALSAETAARTGALSWHVSLSADCQNRRVRLGETTGYTQRNLLGERRTLRSAEADWRQPEEGTALDYALRAACDADFKGPFATAAVKVAETEGTRPPPAPTVAAPPPPPAPVAAPAKPAPAKPVVRAATGVAVQIGATPAEADARALIRSISGLVAQRPTWIETAEVGGRTWRRALVGGFADTAEAARFCETVKGKGRACFVRTAKPG